MSDFNCTITERIAVLSQSVNGEKTLELNRISYNGWAAKLDLRRWEHSNGEDSMRKGITLTEEEAAELKAALDRATLKGEDSYGENGSRLSWWRRKRCRVSLTDCRCFSRGCGNCLQPSRLVS